MPEPREINPVNIETLRDAIGTSGLSIREFARDVLVRDQRTVRRWLDGDRPIPEVVVSHCRGILAT